MMRGEISHPQEEPFAGPHLPVGGDVQDTRQAGTRRRRIKKAAATPPSVEQAPSSPEELPIIKGEPLPEEAPAALAAESEAEAKVPTLEEQFGALREKSLAASDAETQKVLDKERSSFLKKLVEEAVRDNQSAGSDVIKTGAAIAKRNIFASGVDYIATQLAAQHDYMGQLEALLKSQPDAAEALKGLKKRLPEKIEFLRKAAEGQQKLRSLERLPSTVGAETKPAGEPAREAPLDKKARAQAVRRALRPALGDVQKLARYKRPSPPAQTSFFQKLKKIFGGK